jgi:hypothetical protein
MVDNYKAGFAQIEIGGSYPFFGLLNTIRYWNFRLLTDCFYQFFGLLPIHTIGRLVGMG